MSRLLKVSVLLGAAAFALAGCAHGLSAPNVAKIQAFYADLKGDAALWVSAHPNDAAQIAKIEASLDPEIAGLSNAAAPTSLSTVITDLSNGVSLLPAGVLSPAHTAELKAVLGLAQGFLLFSAAPPASVRG